MVKAEEITRDNSQASKKKNRTINQPNSKSNIIYELQEVENKEYFENQICN